MSAGHDHSSSDNHSHGVGGKTDRKSTYNNNPTQPAYYPTPDFNEQERYDLDASFNLAPQFPWPRGLGLPVVRNFDFKTFIKTGPGNNTETWSSTERLDLPLYFEIPNSRTKGSYQWDSFPAGEAQQFLVFSVDAETINQRSEADGGRPLNGNSGDAVVLDALSSSDTGRPFTITLTVTPYNAGPIPHIHWAEDELFILLQGEMDSWIGDPFGEPAEINEYPAGNIPDSQKDDAVTIDQIENFYYAHLTAGQTAFLPRGYAHAYRNASPSGDPLVFLTVWSRSPGYPSGGIEEFFTLSNPVIGRFYDTSDQAAAYGNLYNKNVGSEEGISNQQRFVDYMNTFPDYFVAMSRNFGAFVGNGAGDVNGGGNWNPAIPEDRQTPIPNPPPAYWDPSSDTPWLADPAGKNTSEYYIPPAPNAPSPAVNFSTPFDPKIIQYIGCSYEPGKNKDISEKQFHQLVNALNQLIIATAGSEVSLILKPESDVSDQAQKIIQTVWQRYSDLAQLKSSRQFRQLVRQLRSAGSIEVNNQSVDSDLLAEAAQTLIGKFEMASPESLQQGLALAEALKQHTDKEAGCVSFNYYIPKGEPLTLAFVEEYESGAALVEHLTAEYTTEFFADFAPLVQGGLLTNGDVTIYPINTAESQFYQSQHQGTELFASLLDSMPALQLTMQDQDRDGVLTISNGTQTAGVGGYATATLQRANPGDQDRTYGVIQVDGADGQIADLRLEATPSQAWRQAAADRSTLLFTSSPDSAAVASDLASRAFAIGSESHLVFFVTAQSAREVRRDGLDASARLSTQTGLGVKGDQILFKAMSIGLDTPVQGIQQASSELQQHGHPVLDTREQPRRQLLITGEMISDSSSSGGEGDGHSHHVHATHFGLYAVTNRKGAVLDPITQQTISPGQTKAYGRALEAIEAQGGCTAPPLVVCVSTAASSGCRLWPPRIRSTPLPLALCRFQVRMRLTSASRAIPQRWISRLRRAAGCHCWPEEHPRRGGWPASR
ncbi:MAG: antibiotic biosynthesis monooxygenase [Cyanobium sp.]